MTKYGPWQPVSVKPSPGDYIQCEVFCPCFGQRARIEMIVAGVTDMTLDALSVRGTPPCPDSDVERWRKIYPPEADIKVKQTVMATN